MSDAALQRDRAHGWLGGVCAGLARRYGLEPALVRLAFVIGAAAWGVGIGEARLLVPKDVCVATDGEVRMGNVRLFGRDHGGVDVDIEDTRTAPPGTTRLVLKGDVGAGELRVGADPTDYFSAEAFDGPVRQDACYG